MSTSDYAERANQVICKPFLLGFGSYLNDLTNHNAEVPLWSTRNMFNEKYLQVELLAEKDIPFEKSTDDILNMNTYTCHICDTEVPKTYIKEHKNGEKHKICMRIADIALERTRKQMRLDVAESRITVEVVETYFCEPCTVIVQKEDMMTHVRSERHVKSLKYKELLKDFLMIYEDKETISFITGKVDCNGISDVIEDLNVPETIKTTKINDTHYSLCEPITEPKEALNKDRILDQSQIESEHVSEVETNTKSPKLNVNQDDLDTLSDLSSRIVEQISECQKYLPKTFTKAEKKENTQKASSQLDNYLKTVTKQCHTDPIHSVEALTDKLILITAINGDKIKVSVNNFHSIHKQKDKSYCKICEDPNIGFRHEHCEEHMEKVMIPIEDKNGMRKIDDIWSHCVLCNDLTKNINFHLQSLLHRNKLKQCLVVSGTDINANILHKPNPQIEDTSQIVQEHSLIVSHNNSEITCNICDVTINNKIKSITEHIKSFEHITSYNATIEKNRLNELDESQYYCVPCDMCVAKCYAFGHCNGRKHNKHLTDFLDKKNETQKDSEESMHIILPSISQQIRRNNKTGPVSQNTDSNLICFVCNIILYDINKHTNSLEHKKNYLSYLEANKLNEIEENTFYCIPCNTAILIDYLMNHCTSKKHKNHLKIFITNSQNREVQETRMVQLIAENSHISRSITQSVLNAQAPTSTSQTAVSQNGIFDTAIPLKFLYQFREMSNARNLLCTICDEEVPYRKYEVQTHVNLIDHIVSFNLMMLWNKIKRMNDKYFCDVCKVGVTYFNELSHLTSAQHFEVMSKQPKGTVYEYDKMLLTLEYAMSHKVGDRVKPSSLISVSNTKNTLIE